MTVKELKKYLQEHLVPKRLYKIGGEKKNRICMTCSNGVWSVFFRDRKNRVGVVNYNSEESAVEGMMEELRKAMSSIYGLTWA